MTGKKVVSRDFPLLNQRGNVVYLDSAATSQKPKSVVDAEMAFYLELCSNIGRSVYPLALDATEAYENARKMIARFVGAEDSNCIVFTSGTTMGVNLVAHAWARHNLESGDRVLSTFSEHHANIVPWQILAENDGIEFEMIGVSEDGRLDLADLEWQLREGDVKLVCIGQVSNVTAVIHPIKEIAELVHSYGAAIMVDGAQAAGHMPVDVADLDVDFYAFSGHKMLGPMGIGALYVAPRMHEEMGVMFGGGDMISNVTPERTWFKPMPTRLEAGTPNVAGALGLAEAIRWLENYPGGLSGVEEHVRYLGAYAWEQLSTIPNIRLLGPGPGEDCSSSLVAFTFDHADAPNRKRIKNNDLAKQLGDLGVCVRSGMFCAQPLLERVFGITGAVRASFHVYNDTDDVDTLVTAIRLVIDEAGDRAVETQDVHVEGIEEFMRVQVIATEELGTVVGIDQGCSCHDGWCRVYLDKGVAEEFRFGYRGDLTDLREVVSEVRKTVEFVRESNVDAVIRNRTKVRVCPGSRYYGSWQEELTGIVERAPGWGSAWVRVRFDNGSSDEFSVSSPNLLIVG